MLVYADPSIDTGKVDVHLNAITHKCTILTSDFTLSELSTLAPIKKYPLYLHQVMLVMLTCGLKTW